MKKLGTLILLGGAWIAFAPGLAQAASSDPLFDPVWEIMNQNAGEESPGCRDCHIIPAKPRGLIWGDTEEEVLTSLTTPDPVWGIVLVEGGNNGSRLSYRLECGSMPFFGRPWHEGPDDVYPDEFYQFQLEKLRTWLSQFDDPTAEPTRCQ